MTVSLNALLVCALFLGLGYIWGHNAGRLAERREMTRRILRMDERRRGA
jgi:hypothetical protein